jgi:hypothetical protein
MKPVRDTTLDELEDTAVLGMKSVREYLDYKGNDQRYGQQAGKAVSIITALARIRASESNRMAVELMAQRVNGDGQKKINGGGRGRKKLTC